MQRARVIDLWWAALALLACLVALPAHAQTFPKLTGYVVDDANIIGPEDEAALTAKLAAIQQSTGRQVVVATIADMQSYPLSDYGYRLGRAWGIGEKGANNGVVVFLAPNEPAGQRGPRIEVGYGLEPIMTDAFSSVLAKEVMTPLLRQGNIAGALGAGVDAIGEQIKLTPEEAAKRSAQVGKQERRSSSGINLSTILFWVVIFFFFVLPLLRGIGGGRRHRRSGGSGLGQVILWSAINAAANSRSNGWGDGGSSGWGGGSDWGGGGGGFGGGGGGGFGGGGASGDW